MDFIQNIFDSFPNIFYYKINFKINFLVFTRYNVFLTHLMQILYESMDLIFQLVGRSSLLYSMRGRLISVCDILMCQLQYYRCLFSYFSCKYGDKRAYMYASFPVCMRACESCKLVLIFFAIIRFAFNQNPRQTGTPALPSSAYMSGKDSYIFSILSDKAFFIWYRPSCLFSAVYVLFIPENRPLVVCSFQLFSFSN